MLWEPDIKLIKINHQAKSKLTQHKKIKLKKKVMGTKIKGEKKEKESTIWVHNTLSWSTVKTECS